MRSQHPKEFTLDPHPRSREDVNPGLKTNGMPITSVNHKSTSFWGTRSPNVVKRDPALWELIYEIAKRDKKGILKALSLDARKPQVADDAVLSLIRLSNREDGLLPDRPICWALKLAANGLTTGSTIDIDYLALLISERANVRKLTPLPESDTEIEEYAASLNQSLLALTVFAMRSDDPADALPNQIAPAA